MLVYPRRRTSAMRFRYFQGKRLRGFCCFCLILSVQPSNPKTQPHRKVWIGLNASSFRHISMRRARKGKESFSVSWSPNTFRQRHICPSNTRQETSTFPRLSRRALRGQQVRGAEERWGLAKLSFQPIIIVRLFPSSNVRGRRKLHFH